MHIIFGHCNHAFHVQFEEAIFSGLHYFLAPVGSMKLCWCAVCVGQRAASAVGQMGCPRQHSVVPRLIHGMNCVWGRLNPLDVAFDALVAVARLPDRWVSIASVLQFLGACWLGQAELLVVFLSQLESIGMATLSPDGSNVSFRRDVLSESDDEVEFVAASCCIDGVLTIYDTAVLNDKNTITAKDFCFFWLQKY